MLEKTGQPEERVTNIKNAIVAVHILVLDEQRRADSVQSISSRLTLGVGNL